MKRKISSLIVFLMVLHLSGHSQSFDGDKPTVSYSSQYSQTLNVWDGATFYSQWDAIDPNIFTATDIANGYLQFVWIPKRILRSKAVFKWPYIFSTLIDYSAGSSRGGLVIRADADASAIDHLQEPATGDPGFNRAGIAFYPTDDGTAMIVQFSGVVVDPVTPVTRIQVPLPAGMANLRAAGGGTLRIEDLGTSIYVYYNGAALTRINLSDLSGSIYTAGAVYDSNMQSVGTFMGKEVEASGKVAIAQRDAALRLYGVTIQYNLPKNQTISFSKIGDKKITDTSFQISASASSGLPVEFRIVSGPATVIGNTVSLTGSPSLVVIAASQPGNTEYNAAEEVQQSVFIESSNTNTSTTQLKAYGDQWVATDALGRVLPGYDESGAYRPGKFIGMFYFIWHANLRLGNENPIRTSKQVFEENPDSPPFEFKDYYHNEPENGFYHPSDPWSTRRNLQMLANAGVDFIYIDYTNGSQGDLSLESFMSVAMDMYNNGIPVPKISFFLNANTNEAMNSAVNRIYSKPEYDPLLFKWEGKPLLLADSTKFTDQGLKDHFTWRKTWAFDANQWNFLDTYPQDYFSLNGGPEQMPVCKAQGAPLNTHYMKNGSSFYNSNIPTYDKNWETDLSKYGYAFEEQWSRAHQIDPSIVCVTGWNELTAGAWVSSSTNPVPFMGKSWDNRSWVCVNQATCPSKDAAGNHVPHGWYFVDGFNTEFNRDIEPLKGEYTDNYYYQLISHIRKFKGMSSPEPFSMAKSIAIDGNFGEWGTVNPIFIDPAGDVTIRNFKNVNGTAMLTNTTARNDIVESRATYDANNLYFYVKTAQNLTPSTDPNWMLLYINTDRNKDTGWEGYEYVVNLGVKSSTQTTLKRWNGVTWGNEITVPYTVNGNEMELNIPKSAVLMDTAAPQFYFHWTDNQQKLNDITSFFTDGESAPDRRFDYNFSTSKVVLDTQSPYKTLTIPGTIEFEDFDNGGASVAYSDATIGNSGGAYRTNESVDISAIGTDVYCVDDIVTNEWLKYSANVTAVGTYSVSVKYASANPAAKAILYVDDIAKTDTLSFSPTTDLQTYASKDFDVKLTGGQHTLKFYIANAGNDFRLDKMIFTGKNAVPPGTGNGLARSLWQAGIAGRPWFRDSICAAIVPLINENWGTNSPGCGITNDFWNARYTGEIEPLFTETYTFSLTSNQRIRLWIDGNLVVDKWNPVPGKQTFTVSLDMIAGKKVSIKLDYAKMQGNATVKLEWGSASQPNESVPKEQLYSSFLTSVPSLGIKQIRIYPNPATNQITVDCGSGQMDGITLFDVLGRMVYTNNQPFTGTKTFELSLEKGIYLVRLKRSGKFSTQKVMIQSQ